MLERPLDWIRTRPVEKHRIAAEALLVAATVTAAVTLASLFLPDRWVGTTVGLSFFAATWLTVWRGDDALVVHHGLSFGGLVLPRPFDFGKLARETLVAAAWALALALVCFVPFFGGFLAWSHWVWHVTRPLQLRLSANVLGNEAVAQLLIVALPEEAFYRGYLQTRLDDAWKGRIQLLGAPVGPSILATSALFALGHFATIHDPARLAVFFPSLVFGWLRSRTDGVGAAILFHAMCNLFSETLMRGYGL
jgi:uncharacterized protein